MTYARSVQTYPGVTVVIPMYNEAGAIGSVVASLHQHGFDRVLCVDDGSTDHSAAVAAAAGALVVRHCINLGQGASLQTGLEAALRDPRTEFVVTFDADGQHRARDAADMVAKARTESLDVVLGSRFIGTAATEMPRSRRFLLAAAITFTRWSSGLRLTDTHNGLRVLSRRAARSIRITLSGMAHASEILNQIAGADLAWSEHPVTIDYTDYSRGKGQSNINAVNILLDLISRRIRN